MPKQTRGNKHTQTWNDIEENPPRIQEQNNEGDINGYFAKLEV